ncbi:hypothetical protein ACIBCM_11485 [Streptomyces sp. NPDC051018]|uniref:hypothetical protein n=1 Tax=Streptomyces sp. NPDC051018 TaxID=3365639 RepID=UPI0037B36421
MTYLLEVHFDRREGTTVTGTVQWRDSDTYGFSRDPLFGLQLIMDVWQQQGGFFAIAPLTPETEAEFKELWELYFGRKVRVDEDGYLLADGSTEVRRPRVRAEDVHRGRIGAGSGSQNGVRYIELLPESTEFVRRTARIVTSFRVTPDLDERIQGEGQRADVAIEVRDPRYLDHLAEGAYFQSAFTGHLLD